MVARACRIMIAVATLASCARPGAPDGASPTSTAPRSSLVIEDIASPGDADRDVSRAVFFGTTGAPAADAGPPSESDLAEARRLYQQAAACQADGEDYECYRRTFFRAYALAPNYRILYNLGLIEEQLGHPGAARVFLQAYLERTEAAIERIREVEKSLATLESRTAWLVVRCGDGVAHVEVDGLEPHVDLTSVARCPAQVKLRVGRGKHTVRARLEGASGDASRVVEVGPEARGLWIHRK